MRNYYIRPPQEKRRVTTKAILIGSVAVWLVALVMVGVVSLR